MILIKIHLFKTLRVVDNSFLSSISKDDTASTHIILFLYFTHSIDVGQLVDNSLRLQPFFLEGGLFLVNHWMFCASLCLLCLLFIAFPFGYVLFLVFLSSSVFPHSHQHCLFSFVFSFVQLLSSSSFQSILFACLCASPVLLVFCFAFLCSSFCVHGILGLDLCALTNLFFCV